MAQSGGRGIRDLGLGRLVQHAAAARANRLRAAGGVRSAVLSTGRSGLSQLTNLLSQIPGTVQRTALTRNTSTTNTSSMAVTVRNSSSPLRVPRVIASMVLGFATSHRNDLHLCIDLLGRSPSEREPPLWRSEESNVTLRVEPFRVRPRHKAGIVVCHVEREHSRRTVDLVLPGDHKTQVCPLESNQAQRKK